MKLLGILLCALPLCADVRLPPYAREALENGVVAYAMNRTDVPLVVIRAVLRGGIESEPESSAGLASITAEMLRRGTKNRAKEKFAEELDSLGAILQIAVDEHSTLLSLECLSKDFSKGLDLLSDAIRNPAFDEAELKKLLAQRIDGIKEAKDDPRRSGSLYWRSFFYGPGHPYGHVATEASLGRIDRAQVVSYHDRMYKGANLILAVVGSVEQAGAIAGLRSAFGSAPKGQPYQWKAVSAPAGGNRAALIDKPDATQTVFYIGKPGISRTHPDRIPIWLVNTLIGGRFTSMLNDELRVNSGLTYGIGSSFEQNRLPGRITISASTSTENTAKAVDMSLDILKRLNTKGITAEQLQSAKAYLKGTFPAERLETPGQLADILTDLELFGLNRSEIDDLFSRIDAVTVEQANAVARKYYASSPLTFLFVGQASKIRDGVKKYAPELKEAPISAPGFSPQ